MQKILKGTTQTILSYPRVSSGGDPILVKPTSVNVRIHTPASVPATVDTWTSATVDPIAGDVLTSAAEGATTLAIDGVMSSTKGRLYLVVDNDTVETITVESSTSVSADTFYLASPLPKAVAAGSIVRGFACYKALTTAQTAEAGECVAIWQATIDSVVYQWAQPFQIVRRMPVWSLTPASLAADYPIIMSSRDSGDISLELVIRAALKHDILPLLHSHGIAEENIISVEELEPLHALACVLNVLRQRPDTDETYYQRLQTRFDQLKETTFASSRWYELNQQTDPPMLPPEQQAKPQGNGFRVSR